MMPRKGKGGSINKGRIKQVGNSNDAPPGRPGTSNVMGTGRKSSKAAKKA